MLLFYLSICAGGSFICIRHHISVAERDLAKGLAKSKSRISNLPAQHTLGVLYKTVIKFIELITFSSIMLV
jgi:hypothetical protein